MSEPRKRKVDGKAGASAARGGAKRKAGAASAKRAGSVTARTGPARAADPESSEVAARILEHAEALFAERGYDGVSARDVAEAAGVNKALVFYYFGSKDGLFDRVLDGYYEAHIEALADALAGEARSGYEARARTEAAGQAGAGPPGSEARRGSLRKVIEAYLDFMDSHHRYPRLVQQEIARGGRLDKVRKNLRALLGWTEGALADLTPSDGPLAPRHFFLTIAGMVITYYTLAPALGEPPRPLGPKARAERRAHVLWVVDALLDRLVLHSGSQGL